MALRLTRLPEDTYRNFVFICSLQFVIGEGSGGDEVRGEDRICPLSCLSLTSYAGCQHNTDMPPRTCGDPFYVRRMWRSCEGPFTWIEESARLSYLLFRYLHPQRLTHAGLLLWKRTNFTSPRIQTNKDKKAYFASVRTGSDAVVQLTKHRHKGGQRIQRARRRASGQPITQLGSADNGGSINNEDTKLRRTKVLKTPFSAALTLEWLA